MLTFRSLDQSVRRTIAGLFLAPTPDLPAAYQVYNEDQFADAAFVPVAPFIFLVEARLRPRQTRLPLVLIERGSVGYAPFELGNRAGSGYVYNVHIFARNRGERSDLAAFLFHRLELIAIYDYRTEPETYLYTLSIESKVAVPSAVREDVGLEGALLNAESIAFELLTKE